MEIQRALDLLYDNIPRLTDNFSDQLDVDSVVAVNGLVTVVCSTPHGLDGAVENKLVIDGFNNLVDITAINGDVVTLAYPVNRLDWEVEDGQSAIQFRKADGTIVNRVITEISNDRTVITLAAKSNPSDPDLAVGDAYLDLYESGAANGTYQVNVLSTTSFTYNIDFTQNATYMGGKIHARMQIFGTITPEKAFFDSENSLIPFDRAKIFVYPEDTVTSKSRYNNNDATDWNSQNTSNRETLIKQFTVLVTARVSNTINAISLYDYLANTVEKYMVTALYGQELNENDISTVNLIASGVGPSDDAQISYIFNFEYQTELTFDNIRLPQGHIFNQAELRLQYGQEQVVKTFGTNQ